jgi:hypothetical protein
VHLQCGNSVRRMHACKPRCKSGRLLVEDYAFLGCGFVCLGGGGAPGG